MSLTAEELVAIQDLPDFLRTEHCYNDLQHGMLVIMFRHGLVALGENDMRYADQLIDNITLYLYIHFLNEEEGMAFNMSRDLMEKDSLAGHSESHIKFLDVWKQSVLSPYKTGGKSAAELREALAGFYNVVIGHIDHDDKASYGMEAMSVENTRSETARIAKTNVPMSPFMAGAYDVVKILDADAANIMDKSMLSPTALKPMGQLNWVDNVGRVLAGGHGSLRDKFATTTCGDVTANVGDSKLYVAA